VNCKRPVGTIFKSREDKLLAFCGDKNEPCALRIEIFKGRFEHDDSFANDNYNLLTEVKDKIICQKMDVLFNYASEQETVAKFKDLIEEYNMLAFLHKTDLDMREDKRFNVHKRELIKSKINLLAEIKNKMNAYMEEYEKSGNRDALHTATDVYIREYMPEINNLRLLKYSVMEMNIPGTNPETPVRTLNQSSASIRQLEMLHGEVPRILKFTMGTKSNASPSMNELVDGEEEVEEED
jgi:hypothetical protein